MLRAQPCAPSFVDAMCDPLAESVTDTDEEVSYQDMFNALLNIVTNNPTGAMSELLLTNAELACPKKSWDEWACAATPHQIALGTSGPDRG